MTARLRIGRVDLVRLIEQAERLEDFEEQLVAGLAAERGGVSSIVDFFDVATGDAFDVSPEDAIAYFKAKGLRPSFSYGDFKAQQHDQSFTIAKMASVDLLGQVQASLDSALANGTPFAEWRRDLMPMLQKAGWWGRKEVVDPLTGQMVVAQLGSPWRLETIFRTNMQSAYAAGQWQEIQASAEVTPFLMYDAVDDDRTRPWHAAWDNKVLPVDSPWWKTHFPPNGYNCRCGVIQLSADDVEAMGLHVSQKTPDQGTYLWKNPRTGAEEQIPNGLDPGFANNAGIAHKAKLDQLLAEKEKQLSADLQLAANKAAQAQAQKVAEQAAATAEEIAKAEELARANLARLKAKAQKHEQEAAAQQALDAIAAGTEVGATKGATYKIKALVQAKKLPEWPELMPSEKLGKVEEIAAQLKAKQNLASQLASYKTAVANGKTPSAAQAKAFESLAQEEKDAILSEIATKKAKADAAAKQQAAEQAKKDAGAEPSPAVLEAQPLTPPNPDAMVVVARKTKGSNEGAVYQDTETGVRWMVKFQTEDMARNEVLAGRLYNLAGVEAPELHSIKIGGRHAVASRMVDGIAEVDAATLAKTPSVLEGFAVDAWLANWDVVGLSFDNTVLLGGRALRIDVGGSLRYRAQGGLKGNAFGRSVGEIDSLRDGTNSQTRDVFGRMTPAEIERSVEKVLAVSDADVRALVAQFGPVDPVERAQLADLLIERKRDLAKRYPDAAARVAGRSTAAAEPQQAPARVTPTEQQFVEDSRVNGYAFLTDKDAIEDHAVVVHTYEDRQGNPQTRGFMKLREDASRSLADSIAKAAPSSLSNALDLSEAKQALVAVLKSINFRANDGKPYDPTVVGKAEKAIAAIEAAIKRAGAMPGQAKDGQKLRAALEELKMFRDELNIRLPRMRAGETAQTVGRFEDSAVPDQLDFERPGEATASGPRWERKAGTYAFETASFDRSFAKLNGKTSYVDGTRLRYEADLGDGVRAVFIPHGEGNAWATQGILQLDVAGRGIPSTEKIFRALDLLGIESGRADTLARQHFYLNAFARLRFADRDSVHLSAYNALGNDAAGLRQKLDFIRAKTGVDVEKSAGWGRAITGERQAFGHGRAYLQRPDLTTQQLEQLNTTHTLYHNPQGIGHDAYGGVFEKLKIVIDGGGVMASLTDRMRRGVPLAGSSVEADLGTGGAEYLFTRIRERASQGGTGVYWRTSALRRMDAITYDGDKFGTTSGTHIEENRRGRDVTDFKSVARNASNETIFKNGLSLFDDIDRIVLEDNEVAAALAWMRSKGYRTWPDGRALEAVIIGRTKHNANR